MKRTQAIFMAVALCLALLVSGTAFAAAHTVPGPFKSSVENNTNATFGYYQQDGNDTADASVWVKGVPSEDAAIKYFFTASCDTAKAIPTVIVSEDGLYVMSGDASTRVSFDHLFIRATETTNVLGKTQYFKISFDETALNASVDFLTGSSWSEVDWGTKGHTRLFLSDDATLPQMKSMKPGSTPEYFQFDSWKTASSADVPVRFEVCCPLTCDGVYKNRIIVTPDATHTYSADIFVYVPCEGIDKRWQFLPTTEDPYLTFAHKDDMVIFDEAIGATGHASLKHTLDLGPFVVAKDRSKVYQRDWVVESILNKYPHRAVPNATSFDWKPVVEYKTFAQNSYKMRFMLSPDLLGQWDPLVYINTTKTENVSNLTPGVYAQYFLLNDRNAVSVDVAAARTLTPGHGMYFGLPALSFDITGNERYMIYEMQRACDLVEATDRFCETTTMQPQVWFDTECINFSSTSDPCFGGAKVFNLRGMSFEGTVKNNVATAIGVTAAELFDICLEGCAPKTTLDCNLARVIPNPPTGSEVLKSANFTITPTKDEIGEKTLISPLRVSVYFKKSDFKDSNVTLKAAKEAITTALGNVPAVGRGPVDAFFSVMTLGKQIDKDDASTWNNLVEIATNAGTAQGIKNFFHLWPSQDKTYSVKAAWAADKELELTFYAVFVDGVPADGNYVKAQDGYFVIFDGTADHMISDPLGLMTPWSAEPTITPTPAEGVAYKGLVEPFTQEALSDEEKAAAEEKLPEGKVCSSTLGADTVAGDLADGGTSAVVEVTAYSSYSVIAMKTDGTWEALALPTASDFALAAVDEYEIADGGDYDLSDEAGKVEFKVAVCKLADAPTPTTGGGGGGGGCNAGFAPLALLLLAPLAVLLKK